MGCNDRECHDKAMKAYNDAAECYSTLFDKENGVMVKLNTIGTKLEKCLTYKAVYAFLIAILFIIVMAFVTINTMWAETRDAPERRATIRQNTIAVSKLEAKMATIDTNQNTLLRYNRRILKKLGVEGDDDTDTYNIAPQPNKGQ